MEPLLTVADVAERVCLSEYTVRAAIRGGELPATKLRGRIRVKPEDLAAWIAAGRVTTAERASAQEFHAPAPAPRATPPEGGYRALAKQKRQEKP